MSLMRRKHQKPLLRALHGEVVWPPPVWLMRQAGRFLPEFRAMREKADFLTRCMTPDIAVELTLQPVRRYQMDGAILFSDILILPWALGQSLRFEEGHGPILTPIRTEEDIAALDEGRVMAVTAPVREALRRLRGELPAHTTLLGFAGSPFTVSCYMVEGGGSRDFMQTRQMMQKKTALYDRLIDILTRNTAHMLCAQIEAGAEAVMLFDSWSGLLPPQEFRTYVIEPTRRIVEMVRQQHPDTPIIGFPRLGGVMVSEYAERTGVQTLALDTGADLTKVAKMVPDTLTLQGNLDPMTLLNGGEMLQHEARRICDSMKGRPYVFNLGHGVIKQTPPEHVALLVETIRDV